MARLGSSALFARVAGLMSRAAEDVFRIPVRSTARKSSFFTTVGPGWPTSVVILMATVLDLIGSASLDKRFFICHPK
jgi:hypothetical protein